MSKTHLIIPDSHAHYEHDNNRADWLSKLIIDVNPDVVVHIGDSADLPSLSGYEKGHASFQGRTYEADIETHLDFQERLWAPIRARKKRMPRSVFCVGNHEDRISRAIDIQPELAGTISLDDLRLSQWYDDVVWYEGRTPGTIKIDGIYYAHYFVGLTGRAIGGERPGYAILQKKHTSCTYGHNHMADWFIRSDPDGRKIMGLSAGCYFDYEADWAGGSNKLYWRGIVIKRNVEDGSYDPQFVSLDAIKKEYATTASVD